ncbi:hypothetical protein CKO25_11810 [Thiocapsa imhoffii]|uniref:Large ribosomal RNA subunit accumulation protein YceD n=1 Tax=Thiocapsa imhoffii TaxID=382777 RepID=A0A9X0WIS0_9GAMM|nr:YceD family protein [Thiocapsa imhoffii]MBK1645313.1 hypothetical protein [Thiocapsa imhoffii]
MRYFCALMSGPHHAQLDPWRACRRAYTLVGTLTLSEMPRLAASVVDLGRWLGDGATVDGGTDPSSRDHQGPPLIGDQSVGSSTGGLDCSAEWIPSDEERGADESVGPDEQAFATAARVACYELRFARDARARATVTGCVRAVLRLRCQRCLGVVEYAVAAPIAIALIRSDEEARELPAELDPHLVIEDQMNPLELVEDELLLAIPTVPRHADGACDAAAVAVPDPVAVRERAEEDRPRPFAALAALKNRSEP